MSSRVDDALDKYTALLELEQVSFSKTTRARSEVVRSIPDQDLPEFAVRLRALGALSGYTRKGTENDQPTTAR
jgi:hypothetical protein